MQDTNRPIYLSIPFDTFEEMTKVDVTKFTAQDQKGLTYLSWQGATYLLKKYFPTLALAYERSPDGTPIHTVAEGDGYTGYVLLHLVDTATGLSTPSHYFPCYKAFGAISNPTAYHYNTAIVRGYARLVAITTGLGFSLYLGDDTDIQEVSGTAVTKTKVTSNKSPDGDFAAHSKSPAKRQATIPGLDY